MYIYIGFVALHGEVSTVCVNTMCISSCQVEFVLSELSFFILLLQSRFIGWLGDFLVLKRSVYMYM